MNKAGQLEKRLPRHDLIILDKLGYLPFSTSAALASTCAKAVAMKAATTRRLDLPAWARTLAISRH